jgi:hypothetical protein
VDDIQSDSINFSSGTAPRHPGKSCVPTARDKTSLSSSSSVSFSPFRCTYGAGVRANQVACDCHCRRGEGLFFFYFKYFFLLAGPQRRPTTFCGVFSFFRTCRKRKNEPERIMPGAEPTRVY